MSNHTGPQIEWRTSLIVLASVLALALLVGMAPLWFLMHPQPPAPAAPHGAPAPDAPPTCDITRKGTHEIRLAFRDYAAVVRLGPAPWDPAGVISFRLKGAEVDAVHNWLPLANWANAGHGDKQNIGYWSLNWNEAARPGFEWSAPVVEEDAESGRVTIEARRPVRSEQPLEVSVRYVFDVERPAFATTFTLRNRSRRALETTGGAVGLPGCPQLDRLVAVGSGEESVTPSAPHETFGDEANARAKGRTLLKLKHKPFETWALIRDIDGSVQRLTARCELPEGLTGIARQSLNANSPGPRVGGYLAWDRLTPLPRNGSQSLTVRTTLARVQESPEEGAAE